MRFLNTRSFKVIAAVVLLLLLYVESVLKPNKDFDIFIGASRLIFEGQTCYDVWIKSGTAGLKYYYSPLFAVILFPLQALPQVVYNLVWELLQFILIFRIFALLKFYLPLSKLNAPKQNWFYTLCFICSARFIVENLDLGQMTCLLVWGTLEAMRLISLRRYLPGAALLALIINIKLIPLCFLPYLLYKKEFRAFTYALVFCVIYLFLPAVFIGWNFNNELLSGWLHSITDTTHSSITDDIGRPNLISVVASLFSETEIKYGIKRNLLNLEPGWLGLIVNISRCVLLLILAYLFGLPFKKVQSRTRLFFDLSLICLITPLFFPHQGKYSFFYLLPAYSYCLYVLIRLHGARIRMNGKKVSRSLLILTIASFACTTLTTDGLIGRPLSNVTEYLHFIPYGGLILLAAMALVKPGLGKLKFT